MRIINNWNYQQNFKTQIFRFIMISRIERNISLITNFTILKQIVILNKVILHFYMQICVSLVVQSNNELNEIE